MEKFMSLNQRKKLIPIILILSAPLGIFAWQHFNESHLASHDDTHTASHIASSSSQKNIEHDHGDSNQLVLNDGKKWQTDAALRQGMQTIRDLIMPLTMRSTEQSINAEQAKKIALGVKEQVNYLINNCKLDAKADAVLHTLIADLLKGSELLTQQTSDAQGIVIIQEVLHTYPQYFDHPNWETQELKSSLN
jgi:hypothetical protein